MIRSIIYRNNVLLNSNEKNKHKWLFFKSENAIKAACMQHTWYDQSREREKTTHTTRDKKNAVYGT